MLAKFDWAKPGAKFSAVKLLNSGVVIYLTWSDIFFSTSDGAVALDNLVTLGILFLTLLILALGAAVVDKLLVLGISFLTSFILALKVVLVAKLVIPGVLTSIKQHRFLLLYLVYLNQQEQVLIYQQLICLPCFSYYLNYLLHFLIYQYLFYLHHILN